MKIDFIKILLTSLLVVGCSKTPDCGSSDAKDVIPKIAKENELYLLNIYNVNLLKRINELLPAEFESDKKRLEELKISASNLYNEYNAEIGKCMDLRGVGTHSMLSNSLCTMGKSSDTGNVPPGYEDYASYYEKIIIPLREKSDSLAKEVNILKEKNKQEEENVYKKSTEDWNNSAKDAEYSIENIIPLSKDQATGAVTCKAQINVSVPNWGSASQSIQYKLEKNTDGDIFATIQ